MYSTPGISQTSFSIGRVARSSTSLAPNPGMETSTSTIGTMICGSSSRGSTRTAASPNSTEVTITSGVELREQLTGLHRLAGCNQHAFQASAHLGFKSGVQLGAHGADYLLGGDMAYGFDGLDSDPRGRQILVASRLGLLLTAGLPQRGLRQQKGGYFAAECSNHTPASNHNSLCALGSGRFLLVAARPAHAKFPQDDFQRTELRE